MRQLHIIIITIIMICLITLIWHFTFAIGALIKKETQGDQLFEGGH